jgi:hypothetical protein
LLITGLINFTLKISDIQFFMKFKLFAVSLAVATFSTCIIAVNLSPSTGSVKAGNYGYIDKTGKLVIKSQFREVKNFSQGLAAVKIADKWGYTNKTGKLVIKPEFSNARSFSEGLAAVKLDDKWGYVDTTGKMVVTPEFNDTYGFFEELAAIQINSRWGYIDRTGKFVIKPRFGSAYSFSEGLAAVVNDGYELGYIDKTGKQIISIESSAGIIGIERFSQGLAVVETGGGGTCGPVICAYAYIDKTGKKIVEQPFFEAREFSEKLAAVATYSEQYLGRNINGNAIDDWGYINKLGQLVIKPKFNEANSFSEGLAAVNIGKKSIYSYKAGDTSITEISGKWGYIDGTGKQVISPQFDLANSFAEGLAAVKIKNKCGYINKIGKVVVKRKFATCAEFSEGLAAVKTFGQ